MPEARIGCAGESLLLASDASGRPDTLTAVLEVDGLSATVLVFEDYASGFGGLAAFFAELEAQWRGWEGSREWQSLEHDLTIEARHQHSHVQLTVTLVRDDQGRGHGGWRVRADLTIEPGEQLTQITSQLSALVNGDG